MMTVAEFHHAIGEIARSRGRTYWSASIKTSTSLLGRGIRLEIQGYIDGIGWTQDHSETGPVLDELRAMPCEAEAIPDPPVAPPAMVALGDPSEVLR